MGDNAVLFNLSSTVVKTKDSAAKIKELNNKLIMTRQILALTEFYVKNVKSNNQKPGLIKCNLPFGVRFTTTDNEQRFADRAVILEDMIGKTVEAAFLKNKGLLKELSNDKKHSEFGIKFYVNVLAPPYYKDQNFDVFTWTIHDYGKERRNHQLWGEFGYGIYGKVNASFFIPERIRNNYMIFNCGGLNIDVDKMTLNVTWPTEQKQTFDIFTLATVVGIYCREVVQHAIKELYERTYHTDAQYANQVFRKLNESAK